ncbi:hypothetical protein M438DRAFT_354697 [Aureobasidium pullulans EXF-150]|uniref:Uncharacterized protein n=1 Tax=Aureobasidium pullulans EXF-150 TaxID=1043002 RepID=A0A074XJG6_AURPU|nr:uncharacterized protein M438DRAFT_354697 [Aureobasidium pullulans EXF-150]KEQ85655.1 hypothetical protein M438DRAFT_354697 [Aureobasidium pullulans EXF-150]
MGGVFSSDLETYHRAHTKISYQDIVVSSLRCSTVAGVASVRIAIVVSYSRRLSKIDNPWSVFHLSLSPSNIKHPRTREHQPRCLNHLDPLKPDSQSHTQVLFPLLSDSPLPNTIEQYLLTWMNAMQGTYNNTTVWSHDTTTGRLVPTEHEPDSISYHNALANIKDSDNAQEEQSYTVAQQMAEVKHETARLRAVSAPLGPVSPKIKQESSSPEAKIKQEAPKAVNTITPLANTVDSKSKPEQDSFEGHKKSLIDAVEHLRDVLYQREMMRGVRKEVDEYLGGLEKEIKKAYDHERR